MRTRLLNINKHPAFLSVCLSISPRQASGFAFARHVKQARLCAITRIRLLWLCGSQPFSLAKAGCWFHGLTISYSLPDALPSHAPHAPACHSFFVSLVFGFCFETLKCSLSPILCSQVTLQDSLLMKMEYRRTCVYSPSKELG